MKVELEFPDLKLPFEVVNQAFIDYSSGNYTRLQLAHKHDLDDDSLLFICSLSSCSDSFYPHSHNLTLRA